MKARVKETGEIVEINESSTIYDARLCQVYNASELENIPDTDPDYWTRLEHQATIAAMQGVLSNNDLLMQLLKRAKSGSRITHVAVKFANACAHTLVEELKESK